MDTSTKDSYGIPGAAINAKSSDELKSDTIVLSVPQPVDQSLKDLGHKMLNAAEWHTSAITDEQRSTKYRATTDASYYANGSLSILDRIGKLVFAKNTTEANQAAFKLDQGSSEFYSSLRTTTLGSLSIDTVDGYTANPVSSNMPSTTCSPNKPWIKKLFPTLSNNNLMMITVLELVQALLFKALAKKGGSTYSPNKVRKDMVQIIVDNQQIEDRLFNETGIN